MWKASITAAALLAGCLGPLVSDKPKASANLLPKGSTVPSIRDNADLKSQVANHDGLNDQKNMIVPLNPNPNGPSYWNFGTMTTAPSPIYVLVDQNNQPIAEHPPFVDALPGDPAYSAIHTLFNVQITDSYDGEIITTSAALSDAIDLGLVKAPVAPDQVTINQIMQGRHIASPIVLPDTVITVDAAGTTKPAQTVYGHGVSAGIFIFGGNAGEQPGALIQPTQRVSYLRVQGANGTYDTTRPIFQAIKPSEAATDALPTMIDYTPLSLVVNVDLVMGTDPTTINADSDLFTSQSSPFSPLPSSSIATATAKVATFTVTQNVLLLQQQFTPGAL